MGVWVGHSEGVTHMDSKVRACQDEQATLCFSKALAACILVVVHDGTLALAGVFKDAQQSAHLRSCPSICKPWTLHMHKVSSADATCMHRATGGT